jgi:trimeric autotransporter adhesin
MKQLSKHLNFANAISCIALFVALSGAAYAAKTTLGNKAVKTRNLANGSVNTLKLRNGAVTPLKIRNGAVTGAKIAPGAVGSTQILDGAIRSVDLGGGVVTEGKLKNGAVTETKIFNSAVTNSKIGPNAVATGKIADGAVTSPKLAPALLAQLVKNVTYVSKASGAVSTTTPQSVTAECSAGKQVIGGGARIVPGDAVSVEITDSVPFLAGDGKRTGWTAAAKTSEVGKTFAVEAHAICAEF